MQRLAFTWEPFEKMVGSFWLEDAVGFSPESKKVMNKYLGVHDASRIVVVAWLIIDGPRVLIKARQRVSLI